MVGRVTSLSGNTAQLELIDTRSKKYADAIHATYIGVINEILGQLHPLDFSGTGDEYVYKILYDQGPLPTPTMLEFWNAAPNDPAYTTSFSVTP